MNNYELNKLKPLIKYAGSKRYIVNKLSNLFPDNIRTYYEPFVGGANVIGNINLNCNRICGDVLQPIIQIYQNISSGNFDNLMEHYMNNWLIVQNDPDYYYEIRYRFNEYKDYKDFFVLTRLQHGNTIRFNQSGEFNVAIKHQPKGKTFGQNPNKIYPLLYQWAERLHGVYFQVSSYEETLSVAEEDDFTFLDPPYPSDNAMYGEKFDTQRFILYLKELNDRKIKWMLTYNDQNKYELNDLSLFQTKIKSKTSSLRLLARKETGTDGTEEFIYCNYIPVN